jgi:hypothetical protein
MSDTIALTPSQTEQALTVLLNAKENVLIKGSPGIGKTAIIKKVAKQLGARLVIMYASVSDPTDFKGFPFMKDDDATFVPFGDLKLVLNATEFTILFLDDLGQGANAVQAAVMQLVDRLKDNPNVVVVAATNRRSDRAGVSGLLEPVKSRFSTIVELMVTKDDWVDWATQNNIPEVLIAFMMFRGDDLLCKFSPTQDIENSPSPRTWAALGRMYTLSPSKKLRMALFSGAVGEGAAGEFLSFVETHEKMPDINAILANPKTAKVPDETSTLWALSVALSRKATPQLMQPICDYVERMHDEGFGPFAAFVLRDISKRSEECTETAAFTKLASSNVGKELYAAAAA